MLTERKVQELHAVTFWGSALWGMNAAPCAAALQRGSPRLGKWRRLFMSTHVCRPVCGVGNSVQAKYTAVTGSSRAWPAENTRYGAQPAFACKPPQ